MPIAQPLNGFQDVPLIQVAVIHNTPSSKYYRISQPIGIAGLFLLFWPSLVTNPYPVLLWSLLPLSLLQVVYVLLCIPQPKLHPKKVKVIQRKFPVKRRWYSDIKFGSQDIGHAFICLVFTMGLSFFVYVTIVLFGGPFLHSFYLTALTALHFSLLAIFPLVWVHDLEGRPWLAITSLSYPLDELYGCALGATVGAWAGAIPIPLDWDREWQKWPVTVVTGIYIGALIGRGIGHLVRGWKMVEMDWNNAAWLATKAEEEKEKEKKN